MNAYLLMEFLIQPLDKYEIGMYSLLQFPVQLHFTIPTHNSSSYEAKTAFSHFKSSERFLQWLTSITFTNCSLLRMCALVIWNTMEKMCSCHGKKLINFIELLQNNVMPIHYLNWNSYLYDMLEWEIVCSHINVNVNST